MHILVRLECCRNQRLTFSRISNGMAMFGNSSMPSNEHVCLPHILCCDRMILKYLNNSLPIKKDWPLKIKCSCLFLLFD